MPAVRLVRSSGSLEETIDCRDGAAGRLPRLESFPQPLGGLVLESHVSRMPRAQPRALERRAGVAVEIECGGIGRGIIPGRGACGLSAACEVGTALRLRPGYPARELARELRMRRARRDRDSSAPQR